MKILKIVALLILTLGLFPKAQVMAQTVFFESLYDVPVMEGLSEMKESSTSFDKAQGRIVYMVASGKNVQKDKVLAFYGQVLPQMGWTQTKAYIFIREQEKLEISFDKTKTSEVVTFSLSPVGR